MEKLDSGVVIFEEKRNGGVPKRFLLQAAQTGDSHISCSLKCFEAAEYIKHIVHKSIISNFILCSLQKTHTHTHTVNRWRKQTSIRPWWRRATTASYVVSSTRCSYAGWCVSHSDVDSVSDSSYNVQYSCYVNKSSVTLLLNWVLSSALGFDLGTWLYIRN